jgi:hypothetical protein
VKQCTNCQGNLADFVAVCPYCGVSQPIPQAAPQEWMAAPQNSNLAVASLICGVLFLCAPASIAAVILGHFALVDIKRNIGRKTGNGMAIAGLILGYVGIGITVIYVVFTVIAVRKALNQNVPENEISAIETMKTYDRALKSYNSKCPLQGYPSTLAPLGPGAGDCKRANLIEANLAGATPVRKGYMFQYSAGGNSNTKTTVFALVARPVIPGSTGHRFFYLDEEGIIRQADSQIVGPRSDPVDRPTAGQNEDDKDEQ